MKKYEELVKKIQKHYDPDNWERDNEKPLKQKLMWLKSNYWHKKIEEDEEWKGTEEEKGCDIVILGCNSPSGDYRTYWDIIENFFDNRPWIWTKNLIDYTTGCQPPKGKENTNELLEYIKSFDCELGGFVNLTLEEE
jgi:hypothetical protein